MESAADILTGAYAGRRVLVTGHTGFKGSWLSIWLKLLGAEIIGYALDPYTPKDNFVLSEVGKQITDLRGDVRDYETLSRVFKTHKPDMVFHLAAQAIVRLGYESPKETYDVNVGGTVNLLEACRQSQSVKTMVNITSDKCYENKEWAWGYRENDPVGGYDPYSSSKGCSELVTSAYRNSFFNIERFSTHGKALASVRAGNVIGGGDWAKDRIVPDCIRALEAGEAIYVRNPHAVRPWQFVLEPLGGYLLLGARMARDPQRYAGAWNFGPEASSVVSVREIVELVLENWGSGTWETPEVHSHPHEAGLLALDINKARYHLGWRPEWTADRAVKETVAWYRQYAKSSSMHRFCVIQIQRYMEAMRISDP
jgi:CDP-glucose 4,6-dehydratase